jgi:hypothetical protein
MLHITRHLNGLPVKRRDVVLRGPCGAVEAKVPNVPANCIPISASIDRGYLYFLRFTTQEVFGITGAKEEVTSLFLSVGQCYNDKSLGAWTLGTRRRFEGTNVSLPLKKTRTWLSAI